MYRYCLILVAVLLALAVTGSYAGVEDAIPPFRAEPTPGLKLALLVGVKDYDPNGRVMPLKYADQDMLRLKVVLDKHGYIVRLLVNAEATRNAVLGALATFEDTLADELANSTVLFAFSGHGFAEDNRNFLLTYDTYRNNVQKTGLPLDEVLEVLKKSKAQRQLVWIDACRTWVDSDGRRALNSPNFRPQEAEGLAIMFSSKAGTPSYEDDKLQSGVFSHYLLEGLTGANGQTTDADGWIDMAKLQTYVTKQVKSYGFMVGKSQKPYIAGEYSDTFYLGKVAMTPNTPTPITSPVMVTPPAEQTPKQQQDFEPEMVDIPAGSFKMGSPNKGKGDSYAYERPQHKVTVAAFKMGKYEVTQGQWRAVMGSNPSYFSSCGDDCPVEHVSWDDVQKYIKKLNAKTGKTYRLPSESEWEYACRGGVAGDTYCGGNDLDAVAWHRGNSGNKTHPVGGKAANGFGLFDMSGNVWEWTCSKYESTYRSKKNTCVKQSNSVARAVRGGAWNNTSDGVPAAARLKFAPSIRNKFVGFRLVQD